MSNAIVMTYNIFYHKLTGKADWSTPTGNSIRKNLTEPWEWDADPFGVNQRGHPYQGSYYFSAGRVNGFGFYESGIFSVFGSSTWEIFFENQTPAINDLITTSIGSLSTGEILYRLYLEACAAGIPAPIAFFLNPMAGFHRLVTGWKPPEVGRNICLFQVYAGAGYARTVSLLPAESRELFSFRGPYAGTGLKLIYGDPFRQESKTPFEHFELGMNLGMDIGDYMVIQFITDGYLFSFSPVCTEKDAISTGLSLHWDIASNGEFGQGDTTIDQYSNALDWTIKHRHLFSVDAVFQSKLHAGVTLMGIPRYYSPETDSHKSSYGAGLNSKLFFILDHKKLGRLETNVFGYLLWCYPGIRGLSQGTVYWLFADVAYSYPISKRLFAGVNNSLIMERGTFSGFPNTRKYNNEAKMFIGWNL
ncbi:MAG: DUF3943 domain-containing protein [Treponema sp.]|nr:DUF3943 domain-containing protein [Treponema sp.]